MYTCYLKEKGIRFNTNLSYYALGKYHNWKGG
jgi:hypothetical protein